jgi:hypothetical protein
MFKTCTRLPLVYLAGGVIRLLTITKDSVSREFVPGDKLPFALYTPPAHAAMAVA